MVPEREMILFTIEPEPFPKEKISEKLRENGILTNRYAEEFFSHPGFATERAERSDIVIISLSELGFSEGATLEEVVRRLPALQLKPCDASTGLFFRFAWKDQQISRNSVISGTHEVPDSAVTVLSEPLEKDDAFPKGLYLRNVDGKLWLRGYVCDSVYRFPGDALFAVKKTEIGETDP
jgi:hypothetical protein